MKYRIVECMFKYRIQKKTFFGWKFLKADMGSLSTLIVTLEFDRVTDAEDYIVQMSKVVYMNNVENWKTVRYFNL